MITMVMLKKLILITSVASKRFGVLIRCNIFLSVLADEDLNSSISVGVSEKNADSAAETKATTNNIAIIVIIANKVLKENVLMVT